MAKKKKKQQGHYCRICGDYKANEKFSGKGHAQHICKSCMSAMRSGKNPEDILPEPLPVSRETTRFKKLDKEGKAVLKAFISEVVTEYWQENRQIPFAESFSELKKYIIGTYDEECGILLKDDAELKTYFQTHTITTINKLLKEEKKVSNLPRPFLSPTGYFCCNRCFRFSSPAIRSSSSFTICFTSSLMRL